MQSYHYAAPNWTICILLPKVPSTDKEGLVEPELYEKRAIGKNNKIRYNFAKRISMRTKGQKGENGFRAGGYSHFFPSFNFFREA